MDDYENASASKRNLLKFDANKDLEIDIKGSAAEFLFITDCLEEEEVLRHI